jgi:hypothetical protein
MNYFPYITDMNIKRFQNLLETSVDETERQTIESLLTEEKVRAALQASESKKEWIMRRPAARWLARMKFTWAAATADSATAAALVPQFWAKPGARARRRAARAALAEMLR